MVIKIIWTLIGLNLMGLLVFIFAFFALSEGRNVENIEKDWTVFLCGSIILVILLAAIPLWLSQSTFSLIFSGFFAALTLVIILAFLLPRQLSKLKKEKTFAETYYKNKTQRSIATAIQNNDTFLLKELIKGQDLNIKGTRVCDRDGNNLAGIIKNIMSEVAENKILMSTEFYTVVECLDKNNVVAMPEKYRNCRK